MAEQNPRPKAASVLAEVTGRDESEFTPDFDAYPLPDPEDLERIPADEFYDE